MQCLPCQWRARSLSRRKRQIEQVTSGPAAPHAHLGPPASGTRLSPGRGRKTKLDSRKRITTRQGDEQTDCLHLYKLIKILMPYGKQHVPSA